MPLLLALWFSIQLCPAALEPLIPPYKSGDLATMDVRTTVPLVTIDPVATAKLRQQETNRIQTVYRYYPHVGEAMEAELRASFVNYREEFLDHVEASFMQRQLRLNAVTNNPRFGRLVGSFQRAYRFFPLSTNLAERWALRSSDEDLQSEWCAKLRQVMDQRIRADVVPFEGRVGPPKARLVTLTSTNDIVDPGLLQSKGEEIARTNFVPLARARRDLQNSFPPEEQAVGKFLAALVKENCVLDVSVTSELRRRATADLWAAARFEPGQALVRAGETVTPVVEAALRDLASAMASQPPPERSHTAPEMTLQQPLSTTVAGSKTASWKRVAPTVGIVLLGLIVAALLLRLRFRRSTTPLLPVPVSMQPFLGGAILKCPKCAGTISVQLLEDHAGHPEHACGVAGDKRLTAPAGLPNALDHGFAKRLICAVLQRLVAGRSQMIQAQRLAELELQELEKRLDKVQAPLRERLQIYQKRIAELEQQLGEQRQQNRELIAAQIGLMKQKLEKERAKTLNWN